MALSVVGKCSHKYTAMNSKSYKTDFAWWLERSGRSIDFSQYFLSEPKLTHVYRSVAKYSFIPFMTETHRDSLRKAVFMLGRQVDIVVGRRFSGFTSFEDLLFDVPLERSGGCYTSGDQIVFNTKGGIIQAHYAEVKLALHTFIETGVLPDLHWYAFGKKEVLPLKKQNTKERVVICAPLISYLAYRMVLSDQLEQIYQHWTVLPMKVGMSKFYGDMHYMYKCLSRFRYCQAVDIDSQEHSYHSHFHDAICFLRSTWTRDDYSKHIKALYSELKKGKIHMPDDNILLRENGNPSGHSATIDDNTMTAVLANYGWWCMNTPTRQHHYEAFTECIELCAFGDNIFVSWSDEVNHFMNPVSYHDGLRGFGFTVKSEGYSNRGPYGLPFLSMWLDGPAPYGMVRSVHPEKILAKLFFEPKSVAESSAVAAGMLNELWGTELEDVLNDYIRDLQKRGIDVPLASEADLRAMYMRV